MSYVLHLWERPVPASLAEAVQIQQRLARLAAPENPRFAALAARLTARHPDLDAGHDADDSAGVWTDGPLARNARGPLMSLGLQSHALADVMPWVVAQARALGLVVLDEQAALVHRPDGSALGPAGPVRVQFPTPAPGLPSRPAVKQRLVDALAPWMQAAGFEHMDGDHDFVAAAASATFQVQVWVEGRHGEVQASVTLGVLLPARDPSPLLDVLYPRGTDFLVQLQTLAAETGLAWPGAGAGCGVETSVADDASLEDLATAWLRLFDLAVGPRLEAAATLDGLARWVHEHPNHFDRRVPALALAAAAGRDDLVDLDAGHGPDRPASGRLLRLLRDPIDPIDPPLGTVPAGRPLVPAACLPQLRGGGLPLQRGAGGRWRPLAEQPLLRLVAQELHAVVVQADGDAPATVVHASLGPAGLTKDALFEQALSNLRARASGGLQRTARGPLVQLRLDGRFDAALMLLDELWDRQLAPETPGGALLAVPRADLLLFCDVAAPGGLAALRQHAAPPSREAGTPVTPTVFYRRDGRWEALPPPR